MNRLYKRLTHFIPVNILALIVLTMFPGIQVNAKPLSSSIDHQTSSLSLINFALANTGLLLSEVPDPPPATLCGDVNFEDPGAIRSNFTNEEDRDGLYCRLIANNGRYMSWYGKPLTNSGNIGN